MNKKGFKHNCRMSAFNCKGSSEKTKRKKDKNSDKSKGSLEEIYDRYYRNQVAALYNAVRGN